MVKKGNAQVDKEVRDIQKNKISQDKEVRKKGRKQESKDNKIREFLDNRIGNKISN